ncbi:MAG: hypothetical protein H0U05_02265 [Actinobacteria bacterium]|nr:hypothetical protein [Actinomycetota bacterium]
MRADLPSGTVTFLFTDVEGSTKLLHELGAEGYAAALAEHRHLIRESCARHSGVEVDTQGDAFFFAFPTAPGALSAAGEMTETLASGPIQVRIGLHTGTPLLTDEGYVGGAVHFGARIAASGRGGQVLVSAPTRALLEPSDTVSQGVSLLDLGEHRLKDIEGAVSIFQLGEDSFPPLKTISNTNLPRPASSFVGRGDELEEVLARIKVGARLVTLTGPGGSGKTRLALEAASSLVPEYKAGVFWVGLAALRDPSLVPETIAQTIGAKDGLAEHIGEREMLLLLDNLEQVIESAPELSALLSACPNLTLLVTSRELLRVQGEVEYPVPPLASPEAVSLFGERAQLEPSEEIAELCARLDNLPLAVELAAARVKALSPAQILERLSQRLDLLKGGRDADPRQQTLRATIEWSYDLLSPEEQELFARLSVFAGGCTLAAAEEVAGADLDTLQSLVEKSLSRFTNERYWMLETIREYAVERLDAACEREELSGRHADFVLQLASRIEATGDVDRQLSTSFSLEQDNFREALGWARAGGHTDVELELIGRPWPFWWGRGNADEGSRWVRAALAHSEGERTERRAKVLAAGAMFAHRRGDQDTLKTFAQESLAIARELNDVRAAVWPLIFLGIWAGEGRDYAEARRRGEEALAAAREADNTQLVGVVLNNLAVVAIRQEDFTHAASLLEEALAVSRELGAFDDMTLESFNLADCFHQIGRPHDAVENVKQGLVLAHEAQNLRSLAFGFFLLAAFACREGRADERAAKLLGVAEAVGDHVGEDLGSETEFQEIVRDLRAALGEQGYARSNADGRAMPLEEAVQFALASID